MELQKFIIAAVTTNRDRVSGSTTTIICDSKEQMDDVLFVLEALTNGIAHELTEDLFVIVKH